MTDETPTHRPLAARLTRHRRPLAILGAALAAALAVVWCFVVPDKADETDGIQAFAIRWGHPLCWAFLSLACVTVAVGFGKRVRDPLLWGAAASYAAFLLALAL